MSNVIRTLLVLFAIVSLSASHAASDDLLKSRLLEYQYPQDASSQHRTVQRIILNCIVFIRDNLGIASASLNYLNQVGTYADAGQPILSPGDLEAIWHDPQFPALQVLYGEIEPSDPQATGVIVHSRIFIGDLPSASGATLKRNMFVVTSNTALSEYGRLADGHTYVLVYALILDAIRTGKPPDVVLALVHASSIIYDKLERRALLSEDLDEIHTSILAIGRTI